MKKKILIGISSFAILAILFFNVQISTNGSKSIVSLSSLQKALGQNNEGGDNPTTVWELAEMIAKVNGLTVSEADKDDLKDILYRNYEYQAQGLPDENRYGVFTRVVTSGHTEVEVSGGYKDINGTFKYVSRNRSYDTYECIGWSGNC